jgi:hypothetical protein
MLACVAAQFGTIRSSRGVLCASPGRPMPQSFRWIEPGPEHAWFADRDDVIDLTREGRDERTMTAPPTQAPLLAAPSAQTLLTKMQLIAAELNLHTWLEEDLPPLMAVLQLAEQMMDINEPTGSCEDRADAVLTKIG